MDRDDLCFGSDGVADVDGRGELPVLTQKHRAGSRQVRRHQRMDQPRGEPTLHDEPPELRARGERRVEMQRVMVA